MPPKSRDAAHQVAPLTTMPDRPLRTMTQLEDAGLIPNAADPQLNQVADRFAVSITPQMVEMINAGDTDDPCAAQFVPTADELRSGADELNDPIGDHSHSPVPGIVHRYPDRLLLTPTRVCPVYCRFCFRRESVGSNGEATLSAAQLTTALDYIRDHEEVWEVILSGGDPLLLSPRRIKSLIKELEAIPHVKVIRVHTRIPVVDPTRVNAELVEALKSSKACFVVLHSNHANEISDAARKACALLIDNGIPMLSQTVLLKGINGNADVLENLLRTLVENRIKPYYLHHADRARGTAHFRTSIRQGQALMEDLRGRVSGLCQPEYVLDIPGGAGKIPIAPAWIAREDEDHFTVRDYQGGSHRYTDTSDPKLV